MWAIFVVGLGFIFFPLSVLLVSERLLAAAIYETVVAVFFLAIVALFSKWLHNERGFRKIFVDLNRVDAVLVKRARNFATACAAEAELQRSGGYKPLISSEDPLEGLEEIQRDVSEQKEHLLTAKKRFWKAHGLAKKLGYRILASHKDYLSEPAEPAA